jgi:hypothetical protein
MHATRAQDANRGVVRREFLVLLQRFAERMQAVADKVF